MSETCHNNNLVPLALFSADSLTHSTHASFLSFYSSSNYIGAILKVISIAIKGRENRLAKWINIEPAPFNDPQPPNYYYTLYCLFFSRPKDNNIVGSGGGCENNHSFFTFFSLLLSTSPWNFFFVVAACLNYSAMHTILQPKMT